MILCRFRYRPEDVACKHCTKYRRKQCTMPVCPWIEERAEAGAVTYSSLAADYYRNWQSGRLGERIAELLSNKKAVAYYDAAHTSRFLFYYPYLLRHHGDDTGRRRLATMYLLTATESLCRAVPNIFGLWSIRLSGWDTVRAMSEQEYVLYDNLSTMQNYMLDASPAALGLASNEYVTEFMVSFGVVPANFRQVEAPKVYCNVVSWLTGGTQFTNQADAGGVYDGQWIMATTRWVTRVYKPSKPLPRTGY